MVERIAGFGTCLIAVTDGGHLYSKQGGMGWVEFPLLPTRESIREVHASDSARFSGRYSVAVLTQWGRMFVCNVGEDGPDYQTAWVEVEQPS